MEALKVVQYTEELYELIDSLVTAGNILKYLVKEWRKINVQKQ
jgi:hypothetical protein